MAIATVLAFGLLALWPQAASAQVGYDPTKKLEQLGSVTADANGVASGTFTLPDDVTAGFEVIASGVDPADQPRSVLADVTIESALGARNTLDLASGSVSVQLAAARGPGGSVISVSASGFKPLSKVNFSVRFSEASTSGTGGGALPLTGSNIGLLIAVALAVLLVGTAMLGGSKMRRNVS